MVNAKKGTTGWEVNHQRSKDDDIDSKNKWRLRDWNDHPNDPGWEEGTYSECHDDLRSDVQEGDIIFDTVYYDDPSRTSPIIRSVFVVKDVSDDILYFDDFIFLDGNINDGIQASCRNYKELTNQKLEYYLNEIEARTNYNQYSVGDKPESIPTELWQKMLEETNGKSTCVGNSSSTLPNNSRGGDGCD